MAGHTLPLCSHAETPFDIGDGCIRDAWSAVGPAAVVVVLCASSAIQALGITRHVPEVIKEPFRSFLTVEEAEAIDADEAGPVSTTPQATPVWKTIIFTGLGLVETLVCSALGTYNLYVGPPFHSGMFALVIAATWVYTVIRAALHRSPTPPYDVFTVYLALLAGAILKVGGELWQQQHSWNRLSWASAWSNLGVVLVNLSVLLSMPLGQPTKMVRLSLFSTVFTYLFGHCRPRLE